MRALYPPGFDEGIEDFADLEVRPLIAGSSMFSGTGPPWTARIPGNAEILISHTPRPGWGLTVDGEPVPRREALSWARAYQPPVAGEVQLSYSAPWWRHGGQLVAAAAPVVLVLAWLRRRMDRS